MEPVYMTARTFRPLCLKDAETFVEYRWYDDGEPPACVRTKTQSFSSEVEGEVDLRECCEVALDEDPVGDDLIVAQTVYCDKMTMPDTDGRSPGEYMWDEGVKECTRDG